MTLNCIIPVRELKRKEIVKEESAGNKRLGRTEHWLGCYLSHIMFMSELDLAFKHEHYHANMLYCVLTSCSLMVAVTRALC